MRELNLYILKKITPSLRFMPYFLIWRYQIVSYFSSGAEKPEDWDIEVAEPGIKCFSENEGFPLVFKGYFPKMSLLFGLR